jgi:hypothetical protein
MGAFGDNEGERTICSMILFPFLFLICLVSAMKGNFDPLLKLFKIPHKTEGDR